ncbi:uracil-DNA glycosylase family protein [Lampropedia puyangensis]|nr:uracil-DNA glycosylase family protein [Lampropedia puyangensis]
MDSRRLAMLKAMGVELWWAKAPPVIAEKGFVAPQQMLAEQNLRVQAIHPAVAPTQPLAESAASKAQPPVAQPAQEHTQPAREAKLRNAVPEVVLGQARSAATSMVWTAPARWNAQAEKTDTPGVLLLVDDLLVLGDTEPAARQLLENMVRAMGLSQSSSVWVSWAQKQAATEDVASNATPPLTPQAMLISGAFRVVLAMGRDAAQHCLNQTQPLGALRQEVHSVHGVPTVVTYSPAYLLRATHAKRQAWADLQRVMVLLASPV